MPHIRRIITFHSKKTEGCGLLTEGFCVTGRGLMHRIKHDSDKGDINMYRSNSGFDTKNRNGNPYGESGCNPGSNNKGHDNYGSNARRSRNEGGAGWQDGTYSSGRADAQSAERQRQLKELQRRCEHYKGKSSRELLAELERLKAADGGRTLTPQAMRDFQAKISPALNEEQKRKLDALLERLNKS